MSSVPLQQGISRMLGCTSRDGSVLAQRGGEISLEMFKTQLEEDSSSLIQLALPGVRAWHRHL